MANLSRAEAYGVAGMLEAAKRDLDEGIDALLDYAKGDRAYVPGILKISTSINILMDVASVKMPEESLDDNDFFEL